MDPPCAISIEAHLYRRFENKADNVSLTAGRTLGVDALSVINNCFLSDGRLVAGLMITDYGREKIEVKSPVRHLAQLIKATLRLGLKSQMVS